MPPKQSLWRLPKQLCSLTPKHGLKTKAVRLPKRQLPRPGQTSPSKLPTPSTPSVPPVKRRLIDFKALTVTSVAGFVFSAYGVFLYAVYQEAVERSKTLDIPADVSDRYNKTASTFDSDVDMQEWLMGMGKKRQELVQEARGDVLEVSCGTGRNMEYYTLGERRGTDKKGKAQINGCRSITFIDLSGEMVEIARSKFEKLYPDFKNVAFRAQNAMDPVPPPPAASKTGRPYQFDTIVQTMGLCSHADPVSLLKHLGSLVEPERGQILLLEHGRSDYGLVNKLMDDTAVAHADRHGCWYNRDIEDIVDQSGLEVVESKQWHFGTTYMFVLRPRKGGKEENVDKERRKKRRDNDKEWQDWGLWIEWRPKKT